MIFHLIPLSRQRKQISERTSVLNGIDHCITDMDDDISMKKLFDEMSDGEGLSFDVIR